MVGLRIVPITPERLKRHEGSFRRLMNQLDSLDVEAELGHARNTDAALRAVEKGRTKLGKPIHLYYGMLKDGRMIGAYRIFINPQGTTIWTKHEDGLRLESLGPYVDSGRMVVHPDYQGKGYSTDLRLHALGEIRRLRNLNPAAFPAQYLVVPTGAHREEIGTIYAEKGRQTFIPKRELKKRGLWDTLDTPRIQSRAILSHASRLRLRHVGYVKSNLGMAFVGNLDDVMERVPFDVMEMKREALDSRKSPSVKRIALVPGSFDPITLRGHSRIAISAVMDPAIDKVLFMPSADYRTGSKKLEAPAEHRLEMARRFVHGLGISKLELWDKDFHNIRGQTMRRRPLPQHLSWLAAEYPGSEIVLTVGAHALGRERGFLNELARDHSWEHLPLRLSFRIAFRGGNEKLDELRRDVEHRYGAFLERLSPKQRAKIAGIAFSKIEAVEESSTHVRSLIAKGEPFEDLVPDTVADYIKEKRLYGYRARGTKK